MPYWIRPSCGWSAKPCRGSLGHGTKRCGPHLSKEPPQAPWIFRLPNAPIVTVANKVADLHGRGLSVQRGLTGGDSPISFTLVRNGKNELARIKPRRHAPQAHTDVCCVRQEFYRAGYQAHMLGQVPVEAQSSPAQIGPRGRGPTDQPGSPSRRPRVKGRPPRTH